MCIRDSGYDMMNQLVSVNDKLNGKVYNLSLIHICPLTENYVLQQLWGQFEVAPRYYSDKNSEIDFVLQYGTEIIPVEAKGCLLYTSMNNPHSCDYDIIYLTKLMKQGYGYKEDIPVLRVKSWFE